MSDKVQNAIRLASEVHSDDRWGNYPYLTHLALAADYGASLLGSEKFSEICEAENVLSAIWLHDVIEDHPEFSDHVSEEFPQIFESLKLVARSPSDSYEEFIDKIIQSQDIVSIIVKWSDMSSNLNNNPPARLQKRYEKNISKLRETLDNFTA